MTSDSELQTGLNWVPDGMVSDERPRPDEGKGRLPIPSGWPSSMSTGANLPVQIQIQILDPKVGADKNESKTNKTLNTDFTAVDQNKPLGLGSQWGCLGIQDEPPNFMPGPWGPQKTTRKTNSLKCKSKVYCVHNTSRQGPCQSN